MTVAHLKKWCRQAHPLKEEDVPQPEAWNELVELVQHAWEHSELPQELCCYIQVVIPKPDGGSRGIGLLEAVLNVFECVINSRVTSKVKFHDCLHGFRADRGTDTAHTESKLFQHLAGTDQETLFKACLDWANAFATFHKEWAFKKLHEHCCPPKMLALIALQWDKMQVIPKQADFFGTPFCQDSGQITGSVLGPLVFDTVVDSAVRHWMTVMVEDGGASAMTGLAVKQLLLLFHADDGMIASRDPGWLQEALTALVALFRRAGLEINVKKTKVMMCHPGFIKTHFSDARCKHRITGEGPSPQQLKKTDVACPRCNKKMNKTSLLAHMERIHGEPCVVPPELPEAFLASHQPRACVINWTHVHKKWKCPVEGCPCKASTNANFHDPFMCRHPCDSIHVTEESPEPWNKCKLCGLQCPLPALRRHTESAACVRGQITKRSRDTDNEILQANEQVFTVDGAPTESVGSFRHLGRQETCTDTDWGALHADLRRARHKMTQAFPSSSERRC